MVALTPVKSTSALPEDFWNIDGGVEGEGTEDEDFGVGDGSKVKVQESMDTMEAGAEAAAMEWKVKGQDDQTASGDADEGAEEMESDEKAPPIQLPPELITTIVECLEELRKCLEKAAHTIVSCGTGACTCTCIPVFSAKFSKHLGEGGGCIQGGVSIHIKALHSTYSQIKGGCYLKVLKF